MSVQFTPLMDNLVVQIEPEPEMSRTIQVQRAVEGLCRFARVVSCGPECRDVKRGQRVLASVTAGVELQAGVIMIAEKSVLAYCE